MKAHFELNADFDVKLLPFSPANETDELEIRVQTYNSGIDGKADIEFLFDNIPVGNESISVKSNSYGFARCYMQLDGLCGEHTVTVKLTSDGEVANNTVTLPLTVLKNSKPILDGGFVMIGPPNDRVLCDTFRDELKKFTDDDWRRYISEMNKIGQKCIIINTAHQYLEIEKESLVAHYESKLMPKSDIASIDPIEAILSEADKNGQEVFIGIGNNYGYRGSEAEMTEVFERFKSHKSFYGWYLALELPMNLTTEKGVAMWQSITGLPELARKLSPVKPIMTSPYNMPSHLFEETFKKVDWVDIMMPQDWAGQCAFTIEQSQEMHKKLSKISRENHCHFWANCESFNFTDPNENGDRYMVPRFRGGGMTGVEGFDKQMSVVRPYVEKIMNFMLTGFFTPPNFTPVCGGAGAVKQYEDYVNYKNLQEK